MDALEAVFRRRSIGRLEAPGPTDEQLHAVMRAAAAAPDHLELRPLRLIILAGDAKDDFGGVLAAAYRARCAAADTPVIESKLEKERTKLGRAPVVLVVGAHDTTDGRIPFLEQIEGAAAAAQNACLAATALGLGSMWRTGEPAYDANVKHALGLDDGDAIVGFLYLGTVPAGRALEPHDPDLTGIAVTWAP